ncbi:hypothetical protein ACH5RR_031562 [Cinchona calisaya]|uniref:Uncharacterized protein n=1 Tax=Cinchona calisaya TaxID=153742 RepID=A0ABD2YFL1_9GENT
MGCFLACFGITKKGRRPKGSTKNVPRDHSYGKYVPLDSDAAVKHDSHEMQMASATTMLVRDKPKESSTAKIKKKVSFNLNVRTYEPLTKDEISTYLSEGEEKTMWEYNQEEETAGASMKCLNYEEDFMPSKFGTFPSNYRYQNCRNSYDEEDEIELEESDLDDDELDFDDDDFGEIYDYNSQKISQVDFSQCNAQLAEKREDNVMQLHALPDQELIKTESSNQNARNRSQYALSVLNPVENLTQWKEVKAKARQQLKHQKENIMLEKEQDVLSDIKKSSDSLALNYSSRSNHCKPTHEIAVDASLSNWLASSGENQMPRTALLQLDKGIRDNQGGCIGLIL